MSKAWTVTWVLLLLAVLWFLLSSKDHYDKETVTFEYRNEKLVGILSMPKKSLKQRPALVIFVHGDGALPSDAYGYYQPIWNHLAKHNIASFSWDKKGVGGSEGNWLNQSMSDRAEEVFQAIKYIHARNDLSFSKIGLIGFSQAGWVLPEVARISDFPDFMILVSGAINWKRQGDYMTRTRLTQEGRSQDQIEQTLLENQRSNRFLANSSSYQEYVKYEEKKRQRERAVYEPMDEARYNFVRLNINSDAFDALKEIKCPAFGIFGDQDLNVDFQESARVYRSIWNEHNPMSHKVIVFPNATHGILKSRYFNTAHPGLFFLMKFQLWGSAAFVDGFLSSLVAFIHKA